MRRRTRRGGRFWLYLLLLVLLGAGGYGAWKYLLPRFLRPAQEAATPVVPAEAQVKKAIKLYFADPEWTRLVAEERKMEPPLDTVARVRRLVEELIRGPQNGAAPVLPAGTKLRNVYLAPDGLIVLDFEPEVGALHAQGAGGELLGVFALVHTICENAESVRSVRILVGGEEKETMAGYVRINEPLRPRPELVKKSGR
jgi:spore germination protein GerM